MTKRERMLKESLEGTRSMVLRALGGDEVSRGLLEEKENLRTNAELLAFGAAMNLSIEAVLTHSRKEPVKHESKWICSEWRSMAQN